MIEREKPKINPENPTQEERGRRGEWSEEAVLTVVNIACIKLERENLIVLKHAAGPLRTERNSVHDTDNKIDIIVPTDRGDIFIQVKSSRAGALQFKRDLNRAQRDIDPDERRIIHTVTSPDELTSEAFLRKMTSLLERAYEKMPPPPYSFRYIERFFGFWGVHLNSIQHSF